MSLKSALIVGVLALTIGSASAQTVRWSANGHFYQLVPTWRTWLEAKADAESRSLFGKKGHLVAITSSGEQNFIVNTFGEPLREASLGGFKSAGVWKWVTGEPWSYTNWAPGEPNGSDFLAFHGGNALGTWNDRPSSDTRHYFVEYEVGMEDVLPTSYLVTHGVVFGGTLPDLLSADDLYMTLQSIVTFNRAVPNARIEIMGVAPTGTAEVAGVILETAVSTTGVLERAELFDYQANAWVIVGERNPAILDSEFVAGTPLDAGRFIQQGTRNVRARISWIDRGTPVRNWLVRIDKSTFGFAFQ